MKLIICSSLVAILIIGVSLTITAFLLDYITSQQCFTLILRFNIEELGYNYTIKNKLQKRLCNFTIKGISLLISLFFYGYLYFYKTVFVE